MGDVVSIVNQKGGVGKTTVVMGLASAAMSKGHRVLVVDLDPQGASTNVLGVDEESTRGSVKDLVGSSRPTPGRDGTYQSTWSPLVDVIAASPDLQELEVLRGRVDEKLLGGKTETRLRRGLKRITDGYAVVLIDCPPSLGALTTNALSASNLALIVAEPTALGLRGVDPVANLIDSVWHHHNSHLDLAGVVMNRMPPRSNDAFDHLEAIEKKMGKRSVWQPSIPHRVVLAEAAAQRTPIHQMGSRGKPVSDIFDTLYGRLWRKIAPKRLRN